MWWVIEFRDWANSMVWGTPVVSFSGRLVAKRIDSILGSLTVADSFCYLLEALSLSRSSEKALSDLRSFTTFERISLCDKEQCEMVIRRILNLLHTEYVQDDSRERVFLLGLLLVFSEMLRFVRKDAEGKVVSLFCN